MHLPRAKFGDVPARFVAFSCGVCQVSLRVVCLRQGPEAQEVAQGEDDGRHRDSRRTLLLTTIIKSSNELIQASDLTDGTDEIISFKSTSDLTDGTDERCFVQ